jgi:cytochrome P450
LEPSFIGRLIEAREI